MSAGTSVVVCTHTERRLGLLTECVASLSAADQIVVVVDSNERLTQRLRTLLPPGVLLLDSDGRGVSAARNTGVAAAGGDIVAFIDDDAVATPGWTAEIARPFEDPAVVATGGRILPRWESRDVKLPPELYWVVGCTYQGHPDTAQPITRPIACNMAARRSALLAVGGFPLEFGPSGPKPKSHSNEEIALAMLLRERYGDGCIRYTPAAVVRHFVPAARTGWPYLWQRCVAEGISKADVRLRYGPAAMGFDRGYATHTLLPAIVRYTARGFGRRDLRATAFAVAGAGGLLVTAAAYGARLLAGRRPGTAIHSGRMTQRV